MAIYPCIFDVISVILSSDSIPAKIITQVPANARHKDSQVHIAYQEESVWRDNIIPKQ